MLQVDGYNLIGDNEDGEIEEFIRTFIPTSSYLPWLTQFWPGFNLAPLTGVNGYQWGQKFNLNKFRWPSGASRWAYGHFLCDSDTVAAISKDAFGQNGQYNQVLFQIGNPESNSAQGQSTIVAGETFSAKVYVLPPTPLSGIRGLSFQNTKTVSLYLLTIVDERYFWWWNNFGNQTINSSTTWQSLITSIQTQLNLANPITVDTISPNYLAPSVQAYSIPYEPIPLILDSICYNIGMRFVATGLTGNNTANGYAMQLYNTALMALNNDMANNSARVIVSGGQRFSNPL
jgi:hypothetical protein